MLRAIFMIGLFAMLGLFAVGMVFKLFGGIVGLTFFIVGLAIKVLIVGGLLYFGIRVLAPGTAARRAPPGRPGRGVRPAGDPRAERGHRQTLGAVAGEGPRSGPTSPRVSGRRAAPRRRRRCAPTRSRRSC